jgi:hypothetical protein
MTVPSYAARWMHGLRKQAARILAPAGPAVCRQRYPPSASAPMNANLAIIDYHQRLPLNGQAVVDFPHVGKPLSVTRRTTSPHRTVDRRRR